MDNQALTGESSLLARHILSVDSHHTVHSSVICPKSRPLVRPLPIIATVDDVSVSLSQIITTTTINITTINQCNHVFNTVSHYTNGQFCWWAWHTVDTVHAHHSHPHSAQQKPFRNQIVFSFCFCTNSIVILLIIILIIVVSVINHRLQQSSTAKISIGQSNAPPTSQYTPTLSYCDKHSSRQVFDCVPHRSTSSFRHKPWMVSVLKLWLCCWLLTPTKTDASGVMLHYIECKSIFPCFIFAK